MNAKRGKATISDVANLAQVSEATVSRVLNSSSSVSPSNRDAVLAAIKQLQYEPRSKTKPKETGSTVLLLGTSYLSSELTLSGYYFPAIIESVQEECSERGINLLLMSHGARRDGMDDVRRVVEQGVVDSMVLLYILEPDTIEALLNFDMPCVLLNSYFPWLPVDSVNSDSFSGILLAMQHLIDNGHRRIALIDARENAQYYWVNLRRVAYRHALERAGIPYDPDLVAHGELNPVGGEQSMQQILDRNVPFTAVMCCNDESAFGAMRALQAAGLQIPDDVSVVGHDDVGAIGLVTPSLTTVSVSRRELGRIAVQCLKDRIANPDRLPQHILTAERLVMRESVRNLNGGALQPAAVNVMP